MSERRTLRSPVTLSNDGARGDSKAGGQRIQGLAAVFDSETTIGDQFRERISPQAFNQTLSRGDDVKALFNHNPDLVLGRTTSKTLRLFTAPDGLHYTVVLPDTSAGRDTRTLIKRGDVTGSSFAFRVDADTWDDRGVAQGKLPLRTITKVTLLDVSPVVFPAYSEASVSARTGKAGTVAERVALEKQIALLRRQDTTARIAAARA